MRQSYPNAPLWPFHSRTSCTTHSCTHLRLRPSAFRILSLEQIFRECPDGTSLQPTRSHPYLVQTGVSCLPSISPSHISERSSIVITNSCLHTCRLVSSHLHTTLLDPAHLPALLHAIRVALLPDNALAPARAPPSPAQVLTIKRECARTLVAVLAPAVRRVYFATADEERMQADVERTLDLFGQPYLNKNLIVAVVEAVVGRLFPELLVDD